MPVSMAASGRSQFNGTAKKMLDLLLEDVDDGHRGVHVRVKPLLQRVLIVVTTSGAGGASRQTPAGFKDFLWYNIPKRGKNIQMAIKYTKWP
jgi:hypothetical protein